jgi:Ca2+-binding RTX toxin-like protein
LFVDAAGRILVGGTVSPHSIAVVRFTPNGKIDTTFGGGDGLVTRSIPGDGEFAGLIRLEPGEDNTFYAYTTLGADPESRFEVLRFLNGSGGPPPTGPTIGIVNDILIADGRWGADRITIERTGTDNVIVRVNDLTREFDMDEFDGVLLRGNAGYDDIRVLEPITADTRVRMATIEGGNGNDILQGSSADEVIRAGAGNDRVFGGVGADLLDGGDGDDFIDASDSAAGDTVLAGDGTDTARVDVGDIYSGVEIVE